MLYPTIVSLFPRSLFPKRVQGSWWDLAVDCMLCAQMGVAAACCNLSQNFIVLLTSLLINTEPSDLADNVCAHCLYLFHEKYVVFIFS